MLISPRVVLTAVVNAKKSLAIMKRGAPMRKNITHAALGLSIMALIAGSASAQLSRIDDSVIEESTPQNLPPKNRVGDQITRLMSNIVKLNRPKPFLRPLLSCKFLNRQSSRKKNARAFKKRQNLLSFSRAGCSRQSQRFPRSIMGFMMCGWLAVMAAKLIKFRINI